MSPHHGVKNSKTSTWETGDYFLCSYAYPELPYMDNALQTKATTRQITLLLNNQSMPT